MKAIEEEQKQEEQKQWDKFMIIIIFKQFLANFASIP